METRRGAALWEIGRRAAGVALVAAVVVLAAACAVGGVAIEAPAGPGGEVVATLEGAGKCRLKVRRETGAPAWNAVALTNEGAEPLRGIRAWGLGGVDLVQLEEGDPRPFGLLPGERLVCTTTFEKAGDAAGATGGRLLTGTFEWAWAAKKGEATGAARWPGALKNASIRPDGAIVMTPPLAGEAWVEVWFEAPIAPMGGSVAWEIEGGSGRIVAWVSHDGKVWTKRAPERWMDRQTPLALGATATGGRRMGLRLACDGASTGARPLIVRWMRVERTIQAAGGLRLWPVGEAEARVEVTGPEAGRMGVRLMAL
jgi:hypothetical protein